MSVAMIATSLLVIIVAFLRLANTHDAGSCSEVKSCVNDVLQDAMSKASKCGEPHPCGCGDWKQVILLNMSNPASTCPSPWMEIQAPERSCYSNSKYKNVSFSKPQSLASYSYVCGRAIGYGVGSPDAFVLHPTDIEQVYVDGIGLSHGHPRHHIWTFAAGHRQIYTYCDCGRPRPPAPAFVKSNYFCDGAANGALWDAKDCSNDC